MKAPLLVPGRTVWKIEPCPRAAVLIDGAAFFGAVRAALLNARRHVLVVGWDIDSRTVLRGQEHPDDGLPLAFGPFLSELVACQPHLHVNLLLWDYSLLYANEREKLPRLWLDWQMPPQVKLCLDSTVSFGSSQHQKLVVVDDTLAFCGGLDLTIRRWDTSHHEPFRPDRIDPDGRPYKPFHDVQMMVDGKAAQALALLAHDRWCHATAQGDPLVEPMGDPWPAHVVPDFTSVEIGIARTQPRFTNEIEAREVEQLFHESIDRAEQTIYIENQFTTSRRIADHLARRLRQKPGLEVVIVAPHAHASWIESRTMRNGRIRFWRSVREAGGDRARLVSPMVTKDGRSVDTMVHSKVMIIDDVFMRVGSANLDNRSMGADTECDLAIEAANDDQRAAIASLRTKLLAEHCGASVEEVAERLAKNRSLVELVDTLSQNGHRLKPIEDGAPDAAVFTRLIERIADPSRPLRLSRLMGHVLPRLLAPRLKRRRAGGSRGRVLLTGGIILGLSALPLVWQFTGLRDYADPRSLQALFEFVAESPLAPLFVVAYFVLGGLVAFPVVVLILLTSALFGPWLGMAYAAVGVAASASVFYGAGAYMGSEHLRHLTGKRWQGLRLWLQRRGLLAVVALRVVPMAPFTVVNLTIGAAGIRFADFALGTAIGMAPGLAAMSFAGSSITDIIQNPAPVHFAVLALAALAWLGVAAVAQRLIARLGKPRSKEMA